jgi:hypothetical protein
MLIAREETNLWLLELVYSNEKILPAEVDLGDALWINAGVADLAEDEVAECRLVERYLRALGVSFAHSSRGGGKIVLWMGAAVCEIACMGYGLLLAQRDLPAACSSTSGAKSSGRGRY